MLEVTGHQIRDVNRNEKLPHPQTPFNRALWLVNDNSLNIHFMFSWPQGNVINSVPINENNGSF